jgi:hypothetical protein
MMMMMMMMMMIYNNNNNYNKTGVIIEFACRNLVRSRNTSIKVGCAPAAIRTPTL